MATIAAIAFLGGLILNVMPCVLPVLSIKLASVLRASGQSQRIIRNGFLFTAMGVSTFVWMLAAFVLGLQWIGVSVGWTRPDDEISRFLERHGRFGIPFNIVFGPSAPSGTALPEILTPALLLDALSTASARSVARE